MQKGDLVMFCTKNRRYDSGIGIVLHVRDKSDNQLWDIVVFVDGKKHLSRSSQCKILSK